MPRWSNEIFEYALMANILIILFWSATEYFIADLSMLYWSIEIFEFVLMTNILIILFWSATKN